MDDLEKMVKKMMEEVATLKAKNCGTHNVDQVRPDKREENFRPEGERHL